MGMIWRSIMPLLSTLAALVIIVHSQEEVERGYRRDLRPRVVDTTSYEQPWKAIEVEPLVQHSTRAEVWNDSPEEAPARRRPVRKRKRRPQLYPDTEPQERHQERIQGTYHDVDYNDSQQTLEITKKRRKRPDINHHLTEDPVNPDERPLRRRGLRRKRPVDYDVPISDFISPETGDDLKNDRLINNFSKYHQFSDYDYTERNMERQQMHLTVETDNLSNRLKSMINAENTDMSAYNKTFGVEEQRKIFGDSNIRIHAAVTESSSAADENERIKIIQEKHPVEQSNDDSEDIMVMLKKSKVKKMKLGIIMNGTERSYFPLPVTAQTAYTDYDESSITTQRYNSNDDERNYFHLLTEEDIVVDQTSNTFTPILNTAINADWPQLTPQNASNTANVSVDVKVNSEKSKKILDYATRQPEYINLPLSNDNVIANTSAKQSTEKSNSVISLKNVLKILKNFGPYTSSLTEGVLVSSGNAEKSLSNDRTEANYTHLPLLYQNVADVYEVPTERTEKPVTEYVPKKYNALLFQNVSDAYGVPTERREKPIMGYVPKKYDTLLFQDVADAYEVPTERREKLIMGYVPKKYNTLLFQNGSAAYEVPTERREKPIMGYVPKIYNTLLFQNASDPYEVPTERTEKPIMGYVPKKYNTLLFQNASYAYEVPTERTEKLVTENVPKKYNALLLQNVADGYEVPTERREKLIMGYVPKKYNTLLFQNGSAAYEVPTERIEKPIMGYVPKIYNTLLFQNASDPYEVPTERTEKPITGYVPKKYNTLLFQNVADAYEVPTERREKPIMGYVPKKYNTLLFQNASDAYEVPTERTEKLVTENVPKKYNALLLQNVADGYEVRIERTEKPVTEYFSKKYNEVHDYFVLPSLVSKDVADGGYSKNETEISKDIFKIKIGNTVKKYFSWLTQANTDTEYSKYSTEHFNSVFDFRNGYKESSYFPLSLPALEVITDRAHSKQYTEKSNVGIDLGNSKNDYSFSLPRPVLKVFTDDKNLRDIIENSDDVFDLRNRGEERNYFSKAVNKNYGDSGYSTDNIEQSSLGFNSITTKIASELVLPKNEAFTDNSNLRNVMNTSNGAIYSGNGLVKYSKGHSDSRKKMINTNKWISRIKLQKLRLSPAELNEFEAINAEYEENGVIEPMMLKQILKRSNGSSLSEVLQRHNLSLADLLQGKDEAISALNAEASEEPQLQLNDASPENTPQLNEAESKYPTRQQSSPLQKPGGIESNSDEGTIELTTENVEAVNDTADVAHTETPEMRPRMNAKRRFPTGIRRKLRMRPTLNSTLKAQLSRDLIALSARKYSRNNKNHTKSREWKDIVPLMEDRSNTTDETIKDDATEPTLTTTETPVDTTVASLEISNSSYSVSNTAETGSVKDNEIENTVLTTTEPTTTITIEVSPSELTERPKVTPIVRPAANNSTLRRQAFNNRLKRKRLKQKSSTTENPNDDLMNNFLGMANLVSASQFIERTQKPYTTIKEYNTEFVTELEDFLTTLPPRTDAGDGVKSTQIGTNKFASSSTKSVSQTSTEQSAKFEIEEILNDTMTSERLAKILRERNMTLSELVNHRERGSSHVHLADIFHNASKEPNPPEPFLTKSSIEPISKETYPLRAILEANTHETTTRPTSSQVDQRNENIPVVMDFGNNVNENGESMGIISLFNKFTDRDLSADKTELRQDSDGTPYVSSVISVNATNANDTNREGRVLANSEDWKVLISFMKEHNITTFDEDLQTLSRGDTEIESLDDDLDGDGLMVLDDVQHLQNFENNIAPGADDTLQVNMYERRENLSDIAGTLSNIPSNTKSVAIATAGILGLAAILFLLTYIAFKWKQQRDKLKSKLRRKDSLCAGPIPSPVFENRKGHKHNCSSRSISPMISNTNIYMSTLDSRNGNESPDYTWDSLRKPFQ